MQKLWPVRRWLRIAAVSGTALLMTAAGCGGGDNAAIDSGFDDGSSSSGGSSSGSSSGRSSSSSGSSSGASSSGGSGSGSGGAIDSGADSMMAGDSAMHGDSTMGGDSNMGGDSTMSGDSNMGDSAMDGDSTMSGDSNMMGDSMGGDSAHDAADSMSPDAADAGANDSGNDGSDGSLRCTGNNSACNETGTSGLCKGGVCSDCVGPADDAHCTSAYGSASRPYLCLGGACIAGDCRISSDCNGNPSGGLCGVSTPNVCGKCTSDQQCAGNSGGPVCATASGQCVAGTCSIDAGVALGGAAGTCSANASDICCTGTCQPAPASHACCPGINAAAYCATQLPGNSHVTCVNNVCTVCPQVPSGTPNYLVDPNSGSDVGGTGDNTTAGCAFRTIKRALQVIGTPLTATTITVLGPATVNAGETFPIVLPANVSVTTTGGTVQVDVPAGVAGVNLSQMGTAIGGGAGAPLTIGGPHGGVNDATFGIVVDSGTGVTTGSSPQVSDVLVTNFLNDGIIVQGTGIVRIGAGVKSMLNGRAGLHVTDTGRAIVAVASGATATHFDANSTHGILVDSGGSIQITGTVTDATGGVSTVTTSRNFVAGVSIQQTVATPPANTITGLASFASPNGNGIRIVAGSNVRVRDSVSLNNQLSGVFVTAGGTTSNDISNIDLGTAVDAGGTFGGNTFQEPFSSPARNTHAGVCLSVMPNAGSLHAAGNVFGAVNCATTASTLTLDLGGCDNSMCTGGVCDLGIVTTTGNDIDVSMCGP